MFTCRYFKFSSIFQLHRYESFIGKLLCLPCKCSRSGRRRPDTTRGVSYIIDFFFKLTLISHCGLFVCSYIYPTMDELAAQIDYVMTHFGLKSFIGFGVGAGANILARFALNNQDKVSALCLINCVSTPAGWIEWGYQKLNARYLRSKGMTQGVLDYLMWHHFGRVHLFRGV